MPNGLKGGLPHRYTSQVIDERSTTGAGEHWGSKRGPEADRACDGIENYTFLQRDLQVTKTNVFACAAFSTGFSNADRQHGTDNRTLGTSLP